MAAAFSNCWTNESKPNTNDFPVIVTLLKNLSYLISLLAVYQIIWSTIKPKHEIFQLYYISEESILKKKS